MEPIESASASATTTTTTATQTAAPSVTPMTVASAATPDDRASAFKAVQGGGEQVPGGKLLIAAYAVVWIIVLVLIVRVFRRQSAVEASIAALEGSIRKAGKK